MSSEGAATILGPTGVMTARVEDGRAQGGVSLVLDTTAGLLCRPWRDTAWPESVHENMTTPLKCQGACYLYTKGISTYSHGETSFNAWYLLCPWGTFSSLLPLRSQGPENSEGSAVQDRTQGSGGAGVGVVGTLWSLPFSVAGTAAGGASLQPADVALWYS